MQRKSSLWALALSPLIATSALADEVDFEGIDTGTVVSSVTSTDGYGPILVNGFNPSLGMQNAAVIFDSANPTGGDADLGTPNGDFGGPGVGSGGQTGAVGENAAELGKILIVDENLVIGSGGVVEDPDDAAVDGATLELDFSEAGPVSISSIGYIDVEMSRVGYVELFGDDDAALAMIPLAAVGNNGVGSVSAEGISGVTRMVITFGGSGALTSVSFNADPFVFCDSGVNSTGADGKIDHEGSTSISANDTRFVISDVPPGVPAYLIYGTQRIGTPFGGGTRCVGGMTFRFRKIPAIPASGMVTIALDFTLPPLNSGAGQISPGDRFYWQLWFRDSMGPGGFNSTGGVCVTFTP